MGDMRNLICGLRYFEDLQTGQFSSGARQSCCISGEKGRDNIPSSRFMGSMAAMVVVVEEEEEEE